MIAMSLTRQRDEWTPIYEAMVDELLAEQLAAVPQRFVLGIDTRAMQDGINRSIEELAALIATPSYFIPMRGNT